MLFLFLLLPVGLLLTLRGLERYERLLDVDPSTARVQSRPASVPAPHIPAPAAPFVPAVAGTALPEPVSEAV